MANAIVICCTCTMKEFGKHMYSNNNLPFLADLVSLASFVRAKSREYTKHNDIAPAAPPDAIFFEKLITYPSFLFCLKSCLILSLNAKFKACVGKYLMQFAKLPLQNGRKPINEQQEYYGEYILLEYNNIDKTLMHIHIK